MAKRDIVEETVVPRQRKHVEGLNEFGQEVPDPVPMAPAVGYQRQPSMEERIVQMIRGEHLRLAAEASGYESFEESDDFDVGDEVEPASQFEEQFDPVGYEVRNRLREEDHRRKVESQLKRLRPKEFDDHGDIGSEKPVLEGGEVSDQGGASRSDRKQQPERGKDKASGVQRGVSKGSSGDEGDFSKD